MPATSLWIQKSMEGKLKRFCERAKDILGGNIGKTPLEKGNDMGSSGLGS